MRVISPTAMTTMRRTPGTVAASITVLDARTPERVPDFAAIFLNVP